MKKKTLEELLEDYAATRKPDAPAKHHAVFLAHFEEIEAALEKGWTYADIWRALHDDGRFVFTYQAFVRYVHRFSRKKREAEKAQAAKQSELLANTEADSKPSSPSSKPPLAVQKSEPPPQSGAPPVGKVDMPIFGQNRKPRDPDRF